MCWENILPSYVKIFRGIYKTCVCGAFRLIRFHMCVCMFRFFWSPLHINVCNTIICMFVFFFFSSQYFCVSHIDYRIKVYIVNECAAGPAYFMILRSYVRIKLKSHIKDIACIFLCSSQFISIKKYLFLYICVVYSIRIKLCA